jgi:hypothetical protein
MNNLIRDVDMEKWLIISQKATQYAARPAAAEPVIIDREGRSKEIMDMGRSKEFQP